MTRNENRAAVNACAAPDAENWEVADWRASLDTAIRAMEQSIGSAVMARTRQAETAAAVRELVNAASDYFRNYCIDEANDYFADGAERGEDTGCTRARHAAALRLRNALAAVTNGRQP